MLKLQLAKKKITTLSLPQGILILHLKDTFQNVADEKDSAEFSLTD